jgi:hypothetical protein
LARDRLSRLALGDTVVLSEDGRLGWCCFLQENMLDPPEEDVDGDGKYPI